MGLAELHIIMVLFARTAVIFAITITVIIVWGINQYYKMVSSLYSFRQMRSLLLNRSYSQTLVVSEILCS